VTEFVFECGRNPTIFPHPNPMDVQRVLLVEFEFGFALRHTGSKLFRALGL